MLPLIQEPDQVSSVGSAREVVFVVAVVLTITRFKCPSAGKGITALGRKREISCPQLSDWSFTNIRLSDRSTNNGQEVMSFVFWGAAEEMLQKEHWAMVRVLEVVSWALFRTCLATCKCDLCAEDRWIPTKSWA